VTETATKTKSAQGFYWPILIIGILLIIMPFVFGMPTKAAAGQRMLNQFHSIMQPTSVQKTVSYYSDFQNLKPVAEGGIAAASEAPQLISGLAGQLHMTPAQVDGFLASNFPAMAGLMGNLPKLKPVFEQVSPGLAFYKGLVSTMQANVTNYKNVDSLPNFNLFTWFFVIPGILLVIFSGLGLAMGRNKS
jgi:uncharacterized integral membrane protein